MSRKFVYYNSSRQSAQLLLDLFPSLVAFSLRKIKANYNGPCIRVRRSSDNEEQDIGFDGFVLDIIQLLNFVGSNKGYIVILYDQMENFNATQTSLSLQPLIVDDGSVNLENGLPAIKFSGSEYLDFSSVTNDIPQIISERSAYVVNRPFDTNDRICLGFANTTNAQPFNDYARNLALSNTTMRNTAGLLRTVAGFSNTDYRLNSGFWRTPFDGESWFNGVQTGTNSITPSNNELDLNTAVIGGLLRSNHQFQFNGNTQEVIFYNSDTITDREDIENNINDYYDIY